MRKLKILYEYAALCFGLAFLAGLCIAWSLLAATLCRCLPERRGRQLGRWVIMAGFRLYLAVLGWIGACRFDLSALDALRGGPALILAPNHPGLLDAVMILSRLPDVACILKASLMDNLLFGAGARLACYIRNDTGHAMIKRAVRALDDGSHLLLFPEGTRTTRPPVNAFKGSTGLIAHHARVPVQTVFIETDSPFLGKRWPLHRRPDLPLSYRVRLGRRFDPPEDIRGFTRVLETYFAAELGVNPLSARRPAVPGYPRTRQETADESSL
ncbi:1-acyl-sn-glycerol-3-phosphate acyltransferases [Methylomagnum ishizawai]|uniref:1-acyl-sn-glycerol-3-phosphate acyltransferases n=1 Tax=Methylomagnum ishizawai TaxID=1760988 RepID=A0A1Y6CSY1_9GAMM|nr:lysophospholipid acyltransferase family protein [Methylomagnum ishizawai]SMF93310.1 1-acyl-sn-glycerol-3-phosphate acyltransferases [Methylomagnum ishizawai]